MGVGRCVFLGLALPAALASSALSRQPLDPGINLDPPIECWYTDEFPVIGAEIGHRMPDLSLRAPSFRSLRLYYRCEQYADYYYIDFESKSEAAFEAVAPMAEESCTGVYYYVEGITPEYASTRTPERRVDVTTSDACRDRYPAVAWWLGSDAPEIVVRSAAAATPVLPLGFKADGVRMDSGGGGIGAGAAIALAAGAAAGAGVLAATNEGDQSTTSSPATTTAPPSASSSSTTTPPTTTPPTTTSAGEAPTACFTTDPSPPRIQTGDSIRLDGRCSTPQMGIVSYLWELGDGRTRDTPFITPIYRDSGMFNVSLTVSDGVRSDTTSRLVTVEAAPPPPAPPVPVADVEIAKRVVGQPTVGSDFAYEITVSNNGPDAATNVVITDTLPTGVSFRGGGFATDFPGASCTVSGQTATCRRATLDAGQTIRGFLGVIPSVAGMFANTAQVAADENDPDLGNNRSTAEHTVSSPTLQADIAVSVTTSSAVNGSFHVDITVRNNGPDAASGIEMVYDASIQPDPMGSDINYTVVAQQPSPPGTTCQPSSRSEGREPYRLTCTTNTLAPGDGYTIIADWLAVSCCGRDTVNHRVSVSASTQDPMGSNNLDSAATAVDFIIIRLRTDAAHERPGTAFRSHLELDTRSPIRGRVAINDTEVHETLNHVPFQHRVRGSFGRNSIEAHLVSNPDRDGRWRFDFTDAPHFVPGSLRVELGQAIAVEPSSVVFDVSGAREERVRFVFELAR